MLWTKAKSDYRFWGTPMLAEDQEEGELLKTRTGAIGAAQSNLISEPLH